MIHSIPLSTHQPNQPLYENIKALLTAAQLPVGDLDQVDWLSLLAWIDDTEVWASGGLEKIGDAVLLRSVVTHPHHQGKGIGLTLVNALQHFAREAGYGEVFLLTTDAQGYFEKRLDYQVIGREHAPLSVANSSQFSKLCPSSAVLMKKAL